MVMVMMIMMVIVIMIVMMIMMMMMMIWIIKSPWERWSSTPPVPVPALVPVLALRPFQ